ncbi:hypothetical protein E2C01_098439 [Portunus trituberculatus]|uniref:Uncharacterized protein n=1 Tax=Portunus trituberculatus TaxID=210409 RepID=A0A5B7K895_PORTR|nr:hypothetical protein [Portunus trituberculatus]
MNVLNSSVNVDRVNENFPNKLRLSWVLWVLQDFPLRKPSDCREELGRKLNHNVSGEVLVLLSRFLTS